jgi:hypothetical protein
MASPAERTLSGQTVIGELLRNMELGQFDLHYTVLLPCVFTVYLNPEDYAHLSGILTFIADDARRALRNRVALLNRKPVVPVPWRKEGKEFKIANRDWVVEFLPHTDVPRGDLEIHSELNETAQPGYRGTRTTLTNREPSVTSGLRRPQTAAASPNQTRRSAERVFAEIRYEDDSGPQLYVMTQNEVRVGRGGGDEPMDLALYTSDEVSRQHCVLRRDPATGVFSITDESTNGTWLNGARLKSGVEELLPDRSQIGVAEVLTLTFDVWK